MVALVPQAPSDKESGSDSEACRLALNSGRAAEHLSPAQAPQFALSEHQQCVMSRLSARERRRSYYPGPTPLPSANQLQTCSFVALRDRLVCLGLGRAPRRFRTGAHHVGRPVPHTR